MHQVVLVSSEMIQAGDIDGAERALVAVADQAGDNALVAVLDEMPPRDLLAIMREFDSSKESVVSMLVTPEQFARAIVLEKKYGDRKGERLRAMINAVIHRDAESAVEYLETMVDLEGGCSTLADYFEDRYEELFGFATSGQFSPSFNPEVGIQPSNTWLMEKIDELDHGLGLGNSMETAKPLLSRYEIADGDWMETAWLLRYELSDAFEEVLIILRDRIQKLLDQANELAAAELSGSAGEVDDEEESAI